MSDKTIKEESGRSAHPPGGGFSIGDDTKDFVIENCRFYGSALPIMFWPGQSTEIMQVGSAPR